MKRQFALLLTAAATLLASCDHTCPECNGTGFITRRNYHGNGIRSERCPNCDGNGIMKYNLNEDFRDSLDVCNSIDNSIDKLSNGRRRRSWR